MRTSLLFVAVGLIIPAVAAAQSGGPSSGDDAPAPAAAGAYDYPPPTNAAPAPDPNAPKLRGFELAFALGYAIPYGDYYQSSSGQGSPISDEISGHIPIVIGAGYRINRLVSVGLTFQYGYGMVKNEVCPSGVSCSATDYRLSVEARFHFLAERMFSPWVSAGLGYEWLTIEVSQLGQSNSGTLRGRELLNLEVGGDSRLSPMFTLGPFLGLRVAEYGHISDSTGSDDIPNVNQSLHGWIVFGLRGAFTL